MCLVFALAYSLKSSKLPFFLQEQPLPRGFPALLYFLCFLFLAFFAGFGSPVGFYPLWRPLLFNCPTRIPPLPIGSNGTNATDVRNLYLLVLIIKVINPQCIDESIATISAGIGLYFLGIGGIFLELIGTSFSAFVLLIISGPKITMMIGLAFKIIGSFLLAELKLNYALTTVALSFLEAGG